MHFSPPSRTHRSQQTALIVDSGLGGLSIAEALQQRMPWLRLVYLADFAAFPYGIRSEAAIEQRLAQIVQPLAHQVHADAVVIACNSASTTALPMLRQQMAIPIVGVVPAIKPAAQLSKTGCIGLLATPGTVERRYTDDLIDNFAQNARVHRLGSNELVHWAEAKMRGGEPSALKLQRLLAPWAALSSPPMDTVVLGCTHFPLVRDELTRAFPAIRHWVDSGDAIARRVEALLAPSRVSSIPSPPDQPHRLLTTQVSQTLNQSLAHIHGWLSGVPQWELWS